MRVRADAPAGPTVTESPVDADAQPEPAETRRRRTVPAAAFALVTVVAVALGVLAAVALAGDGGGADDDDRDVRLAAGRFAEQFLTYDRSGFDAWRTGVLELSTGGFAEEFEEAQEALRVFFEEGGHDAVAQVTDVFVGEEDRGAVGAVVVYDREVVGGQDSFREADRYLQLSLLRIDGRWLVDDVIDVASTNDAGGAGSPVAPPTTAAPDG